MITCPICQSQELPGALFCGECGASLLFETENTGTTKPDGRVVSATSGPGSGPQFQLDPNAKKGVALKVLSTGNFLLLSERPEFTLGRVSEGQPVRPDIDLTPYHAYEQGVSRLHASIRIQSGQVTVMDLGSANGTRVNGKKILPHTQHILKNRDVLTLGKFKVQVLIQR